MMKRRTRMHEQRDAARAENTMRKQRKKTKMNEMKQKSQEKRMKMKTQWRMNAMSLAG